MDAQTWMQQFEHVAQVVGRAQGMPYVAVCFACTPLSAGPLPHMWASAVPRDAWAGEHARLSGHRVERYEADAMGALRCLPAIMPPRQRLGAAPVGGGGVQ